ncbi:hypothetical protein GQ457_01G027610 [Hibiscus cannabinus]
MWTCTVNRLFRKCDIPIVALGTFPTCLTLEVEKKSRRIEISLYCLARAIKSFFTCIVDAGYLPKSMNLKKVDVKGLNPSSGAAADADSSPRSWLSFLVLHRYRYYTKSLFKYIAASIGKVVKVDYNTTEGKRGRFARLAIIVDLGKPLVSGIIIDGRRQDVEYEGLPSICFKCGKYGHMKELCGVAAVTEETTENAPEQRKPEDLYGPWMQVVNRRRHNFSKQGPSGENGGILSAREARGSRFAALASAMSDEIAAVVEPIAVDEEHGYQADHVTKKRVYVVNVLGASTSAGIGADTQNRNQLGSDKTIGDTVSGETETELVDLVSSGIQIGAMKDKSVASKETVTQIPSSLNSAKHAAVRVGGVEDGRSQRSVKGRILPASLRGKISKPVSKIQLGGRGGSKIIPKNTKLGDRGLTKENFTSRLSTLVSDSDAKAISEEERPVPPRNAGDTDESRVSWQTNSVFDPPGELEMQGARDPAFIRSFKLLMKQQKPDIVALLEPCISGMEADKVIRKSGFVFSYRVEANSFSRGIWLLWQASVKIQVLAVSRQFIHVISRSSNDDDNFFGTFVYESPDAMRRKCLWEQLLALEPGSDTPWVVGGDLNVIGCSSERSGYDHRPIMLRSAWDNVNSGTRPFRYISAWNDHSGFGSFLESVWGENKSFQDNVASFHEQCKIWNREVFGFISKRKSHLMARLRGIERALEVSYRHSLVRLEDKLRRELDVVLADEESLWLQKSRTDWIAQGDRNTSYFHTVTMARRKQNTVRMLRDENAKDNGHDC